MFRPSAHIVVKPPIGAATTFRFNLIDINGPRRGQRLADRDVVGIPDIRGIVRCPDPAFEGHVRSQLRHYGERNGYTIVE